MSNILCFLAFYIVKDPMMKKLRYSMIYFRMAYKNSYQPMIKTLRTVIGDYLNWQVILYIIGLKIMEMKKLNNLE